MKSRGLRSHFASESLLDDDVSSINHGPNNNHDNNHNKMSSNQRKRIFGRDKNNHSGGDHKMLQLDDNDNDNDNDHDHDHDDHGHDHDEEDLPEDYNDDLYDEFLNDHFQGPHHHHDATDLGDSFHGYADDEILASADEEQLLQIEAGLRRELKELRQDARQAMERGWAEVEELQQHKADQEERLHVLEHELASLPLPPPPPPPPSSTPAVTTNKNISTPSLTEERKEMGGGGGGQAEQNNNSNGGVRMDSSGHSGASSKGSHRRASMEALTSFFRFSRIGDNQNSNNNDAPQRQHGTRPRVASDEGPVFSRMYHDKEDEEPMAGGTLVADDMPPPPPPPPPPESGADDSLMDAAQDEDASSFVQRAAFTRRSSCGGRVESMFLLQEQQAPQNHYATTPMGRGGDYDTASYQGGMVGMHNMTATPNTTINKITTTPRTATKTSSDFATEAVKAAKSSSAAAALSMSQRVEFMSHLDSLEQSRSMELQEFHHKLRGKEAAIETLQRATTVQAKTINQLTTELEHLKQEEEEQVFRRHGGEANETQSGSSFDPLEQLAATDRAEGGGLYMSWEDSGWDVVNSSGKSSPHEPGATPAKQLAPLRSQPVGPFDRSGSSSSSGGGGLGGAMTMHKMQLLEQQLTEARQVLEERRQVEGQVRMRFNDAEERRARAKEALDAAMEEWNARLRKAKSICAKVQAEADAVQATMDESLDAICHDLLQMIPPTDNDHDDDNEEEGGGGDCWDESNKRDMRNDQRNNNHNNRKMKKKNDVNVVQGLMDKFAILRNREDYLGQVLLHRVQEKQEAMAALDRVSEVKSGAEAALTIVADVRKRFYVSLDSIRHDEEQWRHHLEAVSSSTTAAAAATSPSPTAEAKKKKSLKSGGGGGKQPSEAESDSDSRLLDSVVQRIMKRHKVAIATLDRYADVQDRVLRALHQVEEQLHERVAALDWSKGPPGAGGENGTATSGSAAGAAAAASGSAAAGGGGPDASHNPNGPSSRRDGRGRNRRTDGAEIVDKADEIVVDVHSQMEALAAEVIVHFAAVDGKVIRDSSQLRGKLKRPKSLFPQPFASPLSSLSYISSIATTTTTTTTTTTNTTTPSTTTSTTTTSTSTNYEQYSFWLKMAGGNEDTEKLEAALRRKDLKIEDKRAESLEYKKTLAVLQEQLDKLKEGMARESKTTLETLDKLQEETRTIVQTIRERDVAIAELRDQLGGRKMTGPHEGTVVSLVSGPVDTGGAGGGGAGGTSVGGAGSILPDKSILDPEPPEGVMFPSHPLGRRPMVAPLHQRSDSFDSGGPPVDLSHAGL